MTHAWSGSVADLKALVSTRDHLRAIARGYEATYGPPHKREQAAWENSIPELTRALKGPTFDTLQVLIEFEMPVGAERADVVLLGGTAGAPRAFIVELKQWSGFKVIPATLGVDVPHLTGRQQHPSIKLLNYAGKLRYFNARAHGYDIKAAVFLHNATADDKAHYVKRTPPGWLLGAPVYARADYAGLAADIRAHLLPNNLPAGEAHELSLSPYLQSHQLFDLLKNHTASIAANAEEVLANTGMGLTEDQDAIKNEVIEALESGVTTDFIVQGGPGSGKTLLAVSLMLKALARGRSCILALRNAFLLAALREVLDRAQPGGIASKAYPGVSGILMHFDTAQHTGLADFKGKVDLLICDEAQRMSGKVIPRLFDVARVCAIFLDERQMLNPPEQGRVASFSGASARRRRAPPVVKSLPDSIRCQGGKAYYDWIERLLTEPGDITSLRAHAAPWRRQYELSVSSSVDGMIDELASRRSQDSRVALVASFTESKGDKVSPGDLENVRVGYPMPRGFKLYEHARHHVRWLIRNADYVDFWVRGGSSNLKRVASIYGAQGFESDYVGVIWGRDLLYRGGRWVLGDPQFCFDTIDKLVGGADGGHWWHRNALQYVINRYRIFLTRGIRGTLIYCEDEETRRHLLQLN